MLYYTKSRLSRLVAAVALVSGLAAGSARANLIFDIREDAAANSITYSQANDFGHSITLPASGAASIVMDVYAMVIDGSAQSSVVNGVAVSVPVSPSAGIPGSDTISALPNFGYQYTSSINGASLGAFAITGGSSNSPSASQATGGTFTAANGAKGWGTSIATEAQGLQAANTTINVYPGSPTSTTLNSASAIASGFTELQLGTFLATFNVTSPASINMLINLHTGTVASSQVYQWGEDSTSQQAAVNADGTSNARGLVASKNPSFGNVGIFGGGADNGWMYTAVTFTPAGGTVASGNPTLAASFVGAPSGNVLEGSSLTGSLSISNTGASTDGLNAFTSAVSGVSVAGSYSVASGATTGFAVSFTNSGFGLVNAGVTLTGSGSTFGLASVPPTVTPTASYNIIGSMSTGAPGVYGPTETGQALLAGQSLVGLKTQVTAQTYGNGQIPFVTLLAGSSSTSASPQMAWRTRTPADTTPSGYPIISDVVNLTGLHNGDAYAVEMNYDNTLLGNEAATYADGGIYVADRNAGNGFFTNAVLANTTTGSEVLSLASSATQNYNGSFSAFLTSLGGQYAADASNPGLLSQAQVNSLIGAWGVDLSNHNAWSVVNYDAEFGVVPEPGTFALLGAAAGAVGLAYRVRRKKANAQVAQTV